MFFTLLDDLLFIQWYHYSHYVVLNHRLTYGCKVTSFCCAFCCKFISLFSSFIFPAEVPLREKNGLRSRPFNPEKTLSSCKSLVTLLANISRIHFWTELLYILGSYIQVVCRLEIVIKFLGSFLRLYLPLIGQVPIFFLYVCFFCCDCWGALGEISQLFSVFPHTLIFYI